MIQEDITKLYVVFRNDNYSNLDISTKIQKILDEMDKNQQSFAQLEKTELQKLRASSIPTIQPKESNMNIGYADLLVEADKIIMEGPLSIYLEETKIDDENLTGSDDNILLPETNPNISHPSPSVPYEEITYDTPLAVASHSDEYEEITYDTPLAVASPSDEYEEITYDTPLAVAPPIKKK
jgi:hypothetical protein